MDYSKLSDAELDAMEASARQLLAEIEQDRTDLTRLFELAAKYGFRVLRRPKETECSLETKLETTSQTTTENASAEATVTGAETELAASMDASKQDGAAENVRTGDQSMREPGTS